VERLATGNEFLMTEPNSTRVEILADLITNFQEIIKEKKSRRKTIFNLQWKTQNRNPR